MTSPSTFAVCPHDTAQGFDKWALANTIVNKAVALRARFCPCLSFTELAKAIDGQELLWAYLNPSDYVDARARFGYQAIARPMGRADVARVIAPASSTAKAIEALAGKRVAAVNGYLFCIAQRAFAEAHLTVKHIPAKSYAEVMSLLEKDAADFGVTYNDHFDALAAGTRSRFHEVLSLEMGLSHVFAVHPSMPEDARIRLTNLLLGTEASAEHTRLLSTLGFSGIEPADDAPFDALTALLHG